MKNKLLCVALIVIGTMAIAQTSDFESLSLGKESYWDGFSGNWNKGFQNNNAFFNTDTAYGLWLGGFSYSNKTDVVTEGYTNQHSNITGAGALRSSKYAVGQGGAMVKLLNNSKGKLVTGVYVTNSTYAYWSMKKGDSFGKKFGGASGADPDFFKLSVIGFLNGSIVKDSVHFYLADYRFDDSSKDYLVNTWRWVNLEPLGPVDSLQFLLSSSDVGIYGMNTPSYFAIDNFNAPYFAPAAYQVGSTAIKKDSSIIKNWAKSAIISKGPKVYNQVFDLPNVGTDTSVIGNNNAVLSLGDGGTAILKFPKPIKNGSGPDFAVFENGFDYKGLSYLELAFVEVSSNGVDYVRFPTTYNYQVDKQLDNFGTMDARFIHNFAGKYTFGYGTPFDLEDLKDSAKIDLNAITHVKIIDVIGAINESFTSKDGYGNPVNDPWPSNFASSGFDLDAVGVINESESTNLETTNLQSINAFPNPSTGIINLSYQGETTQLTLVDLLGNEVLSKNLENGNNTIDIGDLPRGVYLLHANNKILKIIKQ